MRVTELIRTFLLFQYVINIFLIRTNKKGNSLKLAACGDTTYDTYDVSAQAVISLQLLMSLLVMLMWMAVR